jgi:hypothetical protein
MATRSGSDGTVVVPNRCATVTGKADAGSVVVAGFAAAEDGSSSEPHAGEREQDGGEQEGGRAEAH